MKAPREMNTLEFTSSFEYWSDLSVTIFAGMKIMVILGAYRR